MKLKDIFEHCIATGLAADPRSEAEVAEDIAKAKRMYREYSELEHHFHNEEIHYHPYGDSGMINGTGDEEVKTLAVGIDVETPELLLLDRLREKGQNIDAVMIHHPESDAYIHLGAVVPMQKKILTGVGVPPGVCDEHLDERIKDIYESIHHKNLFREKRALELLNFPAFGCHTPTDNLAWQFIEQNICSKEFTRLQDVVNAIAEIPEYAWHAERHNPPVIVSGKPESDPGKVVCTEFTGGAALPVELIEAQGKAGVGTILAMSVSEKTREMARECGINIIMCGHMASDSLGINLMLDSLPEKLEIFELSGFVRIERSS